MAKRAFALSLQQLQPHFQMPNCLADIVFLTALIASAAGVLDDLELPRGQVVDQRERHRIYRMLGVMRWPLDAIRAFNPVAIDAVACVHAIAKLPWRLWRHRASRLRHAGQVVAVAHSILGLSVGFSGLGTGRSSPHRAQYGTLFNTRAVHLQVQCISNASGNQSSYRPPII